MDRFAHVVIGALLAGSFLVLSVSAWHLLKKRFVEHSREAFKIALAVATVAALGQLFTGSRSADVVSRYQPAKLAAMEGHFATAAADMYLFGWVDAKKAQTHGLAVLGGLSFLVHQNFKTPVTGLDAVPTRGPQLRLSVVPPHDCHRHGAHWADVAGRFSVAEKAAFRPTLAALGVRAVLLPQIANQVGWYTAEVGRQPWVVYGLLRTSDALSASVRANQVQFSLVLFTAVYALLFVLFLYLLNKKIQHGPHVPAVENEQETQSKRNPELYAGQ